MTVQNRFNRWSRLRFWMDMAEALAASAAPVSRHTVCSWRKRWARHQAIGQVRRGRLPDLRPMFPPRFVGAHGLLLASNTERSPEFEKKPNFSPQSRKKVPLIQSRFPDNICIKPIIDIHFPKNLSFSSKTCHPTKKLQASCN